MALASAPLTAPTPIAAPDSEPTPPAAPAPRPAPPAPTATAPAPPSITPASRQHSTTPVSYQTLRSGPSNEDDDEDDFVMIEPDERFRNEKYRQHFLDQMHKYLEVQIKKCDYWKQYFEEHKNPSMANKFDVYSSNSNKNIETLRISLKCNEMLPDYKYDHLTFNCCPVNVDVREKELQLVIKATNLPIIKGTPVYVIAEFPYPHPKDETLPDVLHRWAHYASIDSKKFIACCTNSEPKQMDLVHSMTVPRFNDPDSKEVAFTRPVSFYIEKPKSKTMKRKFRPVKLTFYEKTSFYQLDKMIGTVQLKIDSINDEVTTVTRQIIMSGRRQTEALVDIRIKVREALANRDIRAHEEKIMIFI